MGLRGKCIQQAIDPNLAGLINVCSDLDLSRGIENMDAIASQSCPGDELGSSCWMSRGHCPSATARGFLHHIRFGEGEEELPFICESIPCCRIVGGKAANGQDESAFVASAEFDATVADIDDGVEH